MWSTPILILGNIEFTILRKKPGDEAFWVSFKFPRRGWDQRLIDFNGFPSIETRSCYFCLVLYLHGSSHPQWSCRDIFHPSWNTTLWQTLVFGYLLVGTSDKVEAMLSQGCVFDVVAPTKIYYRYNMFSTSIFRPDNNVVVSSCFWRRFSDENLTA